MSGDPGAGVGARGFAPRDCAATLSECSAAAFERRYRENPDPWNFAGSDYERERYALLLQMLPRTHYEHVFEPGCSVGELTARLAAISGHVLATDIAPAAVARARQRCAGLANVALECADVDTVAPPGDFDLIVFSEIGYYFPPPRLRRLAHALAARLRPGGELVASHWLGDSVDHVLHGDQVHAELLAELPLRWLHGKRHRGFRVDLWQRP